MTAGNRAACRGDQHGTANAYRNHRCRCPDATAANTRYRKRLAAGCHLPASVDNTGVIRRRQALAALGYGLSDLEQHFPTTRRGIGTYATTGRRVSRDTHRRWCQVYDLLSMTPGRNERAKQEARKRGWAPPLAWDDDTIDDPDATPDLGERRARRRQDIAEDARFLAGTGMTSQGIAARLRVSEGYVRGLLNSGGVAA